MIVLNKTQVSGLKCRLQYNEAKYLLEDRQIMLFNFFWIGFYVTYAMDIASFRIFGASLSEPHTDVVAWDSVTRDIYIYIYIYRYRGTDRYL